MKTLILTTAFGICLASAIHQTPRPTSHATQLASAQQERQVAFPMTRDQDRAPRPTPHATQLASAQQERQVTFPVTRHQDQAGQAHAAGDELTA